VTTQVDQRSDPFAERQSLAALLRDMLSACGGLVRSYKRLKSNCAALQSRSPQTVHIPWNGFFFGLWSDALDRAVTNLCETGDMRAAIWSTPRDEPIHNIYHLTTKVQPKNPAELGDQLLPLTVAFALLPTPVSIHWLFLLELYSRQESLRPEADAFFDHIHFPDNDPEYAQAHERLVDDFGKAGWHPITSASVHALPPDRKIHVVLPFAFTAEQTEQFYAFYLNVWGPKHGLIVKRAADGLTMSIGESSGRGNVVDMAYAPFELGEDENAGRIRLEQLHEEVENKSYTEWVQWYGDRFTERFPDSSDGGSHRCQVEQWKDKALCHLLALESDWGEAIKSQMVEVVGLLRDHYKLAHWRFQDVKGFLRRLARATEECPLPMRLSDVTGISGTSTVVEIDITAAFIDNLKNQAVQEGVPEEDVHLGVLLHIYHFFQPGPVCMAVRAGKEDVLGKGGIVLLEPQ